MFSNRKYLSLLLCAALCSSCLNEDYSACTPKDPEPPEPPVKETRTLKAVFVQEAYDVDLTGEQFESATIYVFDKNNVFIDSVNMNTPVFDEVFDTGITLNPDDYQFVAWINCVEPYSLAPCTTRDDGQMTLDVPDSGVLTEQLPYLFYGDKDYTVLDTEDEQVVVMHMNLENYIINFTVTGLAPDESDYAFDLLDDNSPYNFNNEAQQSGTQFHYSIPAAFGSGTRADAQNLTGTVRTMGLDDGSDPHLQLLNQTQSSVIYPTSDSDETGLVKLIRQADQDNFDTSREFDVELDFSTDEQTGLRSVTIFINGWEAISDEYDI